MLYTYKNELQATTMKKLPIGIQTFEKIRSGDYAYVDITISHAEHALNGQN